MLHTVRKIIHRHPVMFILVVFGVCAGIFALIPDSGLLWLAIESVSLAAIILLALILYSPESLHFDFVRCGKKVLLLSLGVVTIGLLSGGMVLYKLIVSDTSFTDGGVVLADQWPLSLLMLLIMCLGTGVFEEGLFRGILYQEIVDQYATSKQVCLKAALVSAIVFGLLHVSGGLQTQTDGGIAVFQLLLKALQTASFGFCMAALFERTGRIWLVICLHATYNFALMVPQVLFTGGSEIDILSGSINSLPVLLASLLLFLPLVALSAFMLARRSS